MCISVAGKMASFISNVPCNLMGLFLYDCNGFILKLHLSKYFGLGKASLYLGRPKVSVSVQCGTLSVQLHYRHNSGVLLEVYFPVVCQIRVQLNLCIHALSVTESIYQTWLLQLPIHLSTINTNVLNLPPRNFIKGGKKGFILIDTS